MNRFKRPPTTTTADEFIEGATNRVSIATNKELAAISQPESQSYPWIGKRSDKQTELFNLRLTEVELEKLRFIASHTPDSMQAFVRSALIPIIERKLKEIM